MAGNRATTQLLARQGVKEEPKAAPPDPTLIDYVDALDYIDDYYEAAREVLDLEDKVRTQAITNFKAFKELKDPPSIGAAVFAEIFTQIVGAIPGGKLVTGAVTAGVFAVQMSKLEKELDQYAIPGMSAAEEREKGPSDKTKAKVEKVYGRGKQAVDAGKAVVAAGIEAAKQRAAASAAEAAAKEQALMQSNRIAEWRKARELARVQEKAIKDRVKQAIRQGADHGKLAEIVTKELGPFPEIDAATQLKLEQRFELALYRAVLNNVTTHTTRYYGGIEDSQFDSTGLELAGGGKPSAALLRQIASLLGHPHLATDHQALAAQLGLARIYRTATDRRPGQRAGGPV